MGDKTVSFADGVEGSVDPLILKRIAQTKDLLNQIDEELPVKKQKVDDTEKEDDVEPDEKHTLDSDEEDEEDHKKMDPRKLNEGQEDSTLDFDGQTKISAFNMKEEEDEGHFDEAGNFIFEKKEEIKDAWLDGIDWGNVKKKAGDHWEKTEEDDDDVLPTILNDDRRKEIFRKLIDILTSGQTVAKALSELKKKRGVSASEERKLRWAAKKAGTPYIADDGQNKTAELSGLADELVSAGHMDAYEWSREKVEFLLGKLEEVAAADVCDMFSDEPAVPSASSANPAAEAAAAMDDTVTWEYKETEDGEVQGPFSSEIMAKRQADGKLGPKAVARKTGSGGFNPAARIDFDLYC